MTLFTPSEILRAYEKARKSRKNKYEVYLFDQNREERLMRMLDEINTGRYIHGKYKELILHDSKKRYIASPQFQDHIVHHLVYARLYPILDRKMVQTSFACRVGYGSHKAVIYLRKLLARSQKKHGADAYYCKIDFSKYFFTINHTLLKEKIRKHVRNPILLGTIDCIINSYVSSDRYDELLSDNRFYIDAPAKGIPIGGILSQLFANFYLNDFDQFLKHTMKIRSVRYMDDLIFVGDKGKIYGLIEGIRKFCLDEKLILRTEKIKIHPIRDGVKFCGYEITNGRLLAGKRIRLGFQRFMDQLDIISQKEKISKTLTRDDMKRLESIYASRTGCFTITTSGSSYISTRGSTEFIRGGNGNNGANSGVFTLNLNWNASTANRNVGFRLLE